MGKLNKMNSTILNIRIPNELMSRLKEEANGKNISMAAMTRFILSEYLEGK